MKKLKSSVWAILGLAAIIAIPDGIAGRPVYHSLTRAELIGRSSFVFAGAPSGERPAMSCANESTRWRVSRVFKGDRSLEGKVISAAQHNYRIFAGAGGGKLPSFAAYRYEGKKTDKESSAIVYVNRRDDGCFELAADGAIENRSAEAELPKGLDLGT